MVLNIDVVLGGFNAGENSSVNGGFFVRRAGGARADAAQHLNGAVNPSRVPERKKLKMKVSKFQFT